MLCSDLHPDMFDGMHMHAYAYSSSRPDTCGMTNAKDRCLRQTCTHEDSVRTCITVLASECTVAQADHVRERHIGSTLCAVFAEPSAHWTAHVGAM